MAAAQETPRRDRRHARRDDSVAEVVEVALAVMAEHGAGGMTLGEVARRMGMRTPSLYGYFPSKAALYDAVFARGWSELRDVLRAQRALAGHVVDLEGYLLGLADAFVRWAVEHPTYAELMFWRPVPGYHPAEAAYQPAVETLDEARGIVVTLQQGGLLASGSSVDQMLGTWTVLVAGVVTQQLANAPQETFDEGTFTALLPDLVAMFVHRHARR